MTLTSQPPFSLDFCEKPAVFACFGEKVQFCLQLCVVYYHGHAADYYSDHTEEMTVAGDVDENGDISIIDALLVNQVILNGRQLTETQSYVADVNRNGIVDASDALDILMHTIDLYTIS